MRRAVCGALFKLMLLGCTSTGVGNPEAISQRDQALIDSGSDAMSAGDTSSSITSITTLALSDPSRWTDSVSVAALVETLTPLFFEPAGCLVTSRDDATVRFNFEGCRTGAFGLAELNGEMVADYRVDGPGTLGIATTTDNSFTLGLQSVALDTEGFLALSASERTLVWNGRYQVERPLRPDLDHQNAYLATYDKGTQCLSLEGSATTMFDGRAGVETSITDYVRCGPRGTCPSTGQLTLTALPDRDRSLTLEYDGDDTVWVRERQVEVEVDCQP